MLPLLRDDEADNQVPVASVVPESCCVSSDVLAQDLAAYCESTLDEWHRPAIDSMSQCADMTG